MLKIAICDDDLKFTGELETLVMKECQRSSTRCETDVFSDGKNLLESFQQGAHYQLIFIDIEMAHLDGITTARKIREIDRTTLLIYVSSYDTYLKELFEVEPFRFLSKPLNQGLFARYFKEACKRINETDVFYQFTFNKQIHKVPVKDIAYFESANRIVYVNLKDGSSEHFYGKLANVENELAQSRQYFLRIHQSFLVNYDYITKMNFFNVTIDYAGTQIELKISEDCQKEIRNQICKIAGGKAVVEE